MKPVRILIGDDHQLIRDALRALLGGHYGWQICGYARTGYDAVEQAKKLKPDVIILDFSMPELNGLEATRRIVAAQPNAEVLLLTMHEDAHLIREAWAAGAHGCVFKSDGNELIVRAVEALSQHRTFFSPKASSMLAAGWLCAQKTPLAARTLPELTPREQQVVRLVATGKSSKQVASELGLSVKTVETHRANLMRRLSIHSVSELVRYAVRHKLVDA